jgi:hypothetical protein
LAILVAVTATSAFAGDILIGGRNAAEASKTTTAKIITATELKNEITFEISDYLWTFVSVINQFKF